MPKVLVVDDDHSLTTAISVRLRAQGFITLTANDADEGTEIAVRERPDVIILDIDMPTYTGFEFTECLKFSEQCRGIPIVYLSGVDNQLNRLTAFQQGAAAFISKPYEWKQLLATIQDIVGKPADVTG